MNDPASAPPPASAQPGPEPLSGDLPVWLRRLSLALLSLVLLTPALIILQPLPIYGDDHSSHLAAIHHLLNLLRAGKTDLFCPTFNLGFPMYLYYQPLPHLCAVLVHGLSLGLLGEQLAFNLTVVALWCLYPLTTYLGARRLGLGDTASLLAALCAPAVTSSLPFGFTLHSVMGLGLYTQHYAMVLFPLVLGWTWRALHQEAPAGQGVAAPGNGVLAAAGLHVLIWLAHAFYGVAAATAAVVMVLVRPRCLPASLPRLLRIGSITLLSLLFWLVPLALTRDYAGGWPWEGVDRWEGYGAGRVLGELLRGRLFDEHPLPLLSLAVAGGVLTAALGLRRSALQRALLALFLTFVLFLVGRRSLGFLVDLQPANRGLQLFRYIGPLHGLGVLLAGLALARLSRFLTRYLPRLWALAAVSVLLVPPLVGLTIRGRSLFHTIRAYPVKEGDLAAAGQAVARAIGQGVPPGRVYAHSRVGTGAHLVAAAMALHTDQPMGQSYGLSMHDSLGFYYLEHVDPLDPQQRALYNFRFALASPQSAFARLQLAAGNQPILRRPALLAFALPGRHGYLLPVDLSMALVGKPRELRPAALRWLSSAWPAARRFAMLLPDQALVPAWLSPVLRARGELVETLVRGAWLPFDGPLPLPPGPGGGPAGEVLEENTGLDGYSGLVRMKRPGAVALKVNYHPFWSAELDGQPAPLLHLSPCFLGVQVPAGVHRLSFRFRNPLYQKLLFLGSLLGWTLAGGAWLARRRARRSRRAP